jgi:hypothetical protein
MMNLLCDTHCKTGHALTQLRLLQTAGGEHEKINRALIRRQEMAVEDYDERRHLARDVRDAHVDAKTAKTLATLALILSAVALTLSIMAWNKANDAIGNATRAINITESQ